MATSLNRTLYFLGDFFQFDPERQTSLFLPEPRDHNGQKPESLAKQVAGHKLILQFTTVVILREQVCTAGRARLQGVLRRLCDGQETELDFQWLCGRLYNQSSKLSFADGLRGVTPLSQDRWDLNIAAVLQWAGTPACPLGTLRTIWSFCKERPT